MRFYSKGEGVNANEFRKELVKTMPGFVWTIHRPKATGYLEATGTQSSGFNRLSTISVTRREIDGKAIYTTKSAGFGLRAPWLHTNEDETLARTLRGLQSHYEEKANMYRSHASRMEAGRGVAHNVRVQGSAGALSGASPATKGSTPGRGKTNEQHNA